MNIVRNQKREAQLIRNLNVQELEGVHLTSVIGCLRKAYYDQTEPLPATKMMMFYNVIGTMFQRRFYKKSNCAKVFDVHINGGVLHASPDNFKEAADFKTTRKFVQSDLPDYWSPQLAFYAWCLGRGNLNWKVDVFYIGQSYPKKKDIPEWAPPAEEANAPNLICYTIEFTDEEIEEYVGYVLDRAEELFQRIKRQCTPPPEKTFLCGECQYNLSCMVEEENE